jgi:hypothetical protein
VGPGGNPVPAPITRVSDDLLVTDIAGNLGPDFLRGLDRELRWQVEKEKLEYHQQVARRAQEDRLVIERPWVEGLGQRKLAMPARTYFRWLQQNPDDVQDPAWIDSIYRDNPELRGDRL